MSKIRTRFAPSPTGYLHVGGARTALFSWLFARKNGGEFILRVEDTDAARNTEEARDAIFSGMKWLGLDWDGDVFFQSQRKEIYDAYFQKLLDAERVYEADGAWRFRFTRESMTMHDLVCGDVTIDYRDESNTPDMVIKRSDGSYVFHFVNVVDDLEMKISHVIRGEDHLMNTPKHIQLFQAFGVQPPHYAHIPLILNADGSKMSKRDVGAAVGDYPKRGFVPQAVVNFLALLGWSSKTDEEIFSLNDLVERFSLEAVNRAPARFDSEKCAWVNQQHLLKMSADEFANAALPYVKNAGFSPDEKFSAYAATIKEKIRLLDEVPEAMSMYLHTEISYDAAAVEKVKSNPQAANVLEKIAQAISSSAALNETSAKEIITQVATAENVKAGQMMFPVRVAVSGKASGPDLAAMMTLLGNEKVAARILAFVKMLG